MKASAIIGVIIFLLGSLTPALGKANRPTVFLNHFYIILDSATYKDIEQSVFLRRNFSVTERRTTVRNDKTYTGLYFYGTNTYFEFFDISNEPTAQVGYSGIAFGVDQAGALEAISKELAPEISLGPDPVTRQFKGK